MLDLGGGQRGGQRVIPGRKGGLFNRLLWGLAIILDAAPVFNFWHMAPDTATRLLVRLGEMPPQKPVVSLPGGIEMVPEWHEARARGRTAAMQAMDKLLYPEPEPCLICRSGGDCTRGGDGPGCAYVVWSDEQQSP